VVSVVDGETNAAPDGLQQLQAMLDGGFKEAIGQTLGFDLVEVERGRVVFEGKPDRSVYNPFGAVHGGYAATLLDSACGIATHSRPVRAAAPRRAAVRLRQPRSAWTHEVDLRPFKEPF
jgi:acyl-coenzyme A thioesterase PaaI-like protein